MVGMIVQDVIPDLLVVLEHQLAVRTGVRFVTAHGDLLSALGPAHHCVRIDR